MLYGANMKSRFASLLAVSFAIGGTFVAQSAHAFADDPPPPTETTTPATTTVGPTAATPPPTTKVETTIATTPPNATPHDEVTTESTSSGPKQRFYGWQNILVAYGGVAIAASAVGGHELGVTFGVGVGIYGLGGPIVHLAHGYPGRAVGSLMINAALPALGLLIGGSASHCTGHEECNPDFGPAIAGVTLGMLAAPLLDAFLMGYEDEPKPNQGVASLVPAVAIGRKDGQGISTTTFGLSGAF